METEVVAVAAQIQWERFLTLGSLYQAEKTEGCVCVPITDNKTDGRRAERRPRPQPCLGGQESGEKTKDRETQ